MPWIQDYRLILANRSEVILNRIIVNMQDVQKAELKIKKSILCLQTLHTVMTAIYYLLKYLLFRYRKNPFTDKYRN